MISYALNAKRGSRDDGESETFVADDPNLVTSTITSTYGTKWNGNAGAFSGGNFAPITNAGVRRLTPTECERLQGLPDGWTDLGGTPDSRRYSALGDAVTATVGEWLGRRFVCNG